MPWPRGWLGSALVVGGVALAVSDEPGNVRPGGAADLAPHPIGTSILVAAGMFYLGK